MTKTKKNYEQFFCVALKQTNSLSSFYSSGILHITKGSKYKINTRAYFV